jgi:hypothetical protein
MVRIDAAEETPLRAQTQCLETQLETQAQTHLRAEGTNISTRGVSACEGGHVRHEVAHVGVQGG